MSSKVRKFCINQGLTLEVKGFTRNMTSANLAKVDSVICDLCVI